MATVFSAVGIPASIVSADDGASVGGTFQVVTDLVISDIRVSAITKSSATVSWVTNVPASSQVFYDTVFHGNMADYARHTIESTVLVTEHSIRLTSLAERTTYHFRVRSAVDGLEGVSSDYTFRTRSRSAPGPGPAPSPVTDYLRLVIFGEVSLWPIDSSGHLLEDVNVTSADGRVNIFLGEGTVCRDDSGKLLSNLSIEVEENVPDIPQGYFFLNYAFDLAPHDATFAPYLQLTFAYEEQDIPQGIAEDDLYIAYYGDEWVPLTSLVDSQRNEVSTNVTHFTVFGIMAKTPPSPSPAEFVISNLNISPVEVEAGGEIAIALEVKNIGGMEGTHPVSLWINNSLEETKEVTLAPGVVKTISFIVTRDEPGTYSVDIDDLTGLFTVKEVKPTLLPQAPSLRINWAVLGPVIGVVVFLAIFLPLKLKRRKIS